MARRGEISIQAVSVLVGSLAHLHNPLPLLSFFPSLSFPWDARSSIIERLSSRYLPRALYPAPSSQRNNSHTYTSSPEQRPILCILIMTQTLGFGFGFACG